MYTSSDDLFISPFERKHNEMTIFCILFTYQNIFMDQNFFPDFDPVSNIWNNPFKTKLIAHVEQMGQMAHDPGRVINFHPSSSPG